MIDNENIYKKRETAPYFFYPMFHPSKNLLNDTDINSFYQTLEEKCSVPTKAEIYIHIPFCDSFCHMCACYKTHTPRDNKVFINYVANLKREIEAYSRMPYVQSLDVDSVYFGGGTPSTLPPELIEDLIYFIVNKLPIKATTEITFEGDVRTLKDKNRLQVLQKVGCRRISFGVQSFDKSVRKLSGLVPTIQEISECISNLQEFGYKINFDLMYGLPGQDINIWKKDLETALSLGVEGLDIYETIVYPTTKLFRLRHKLTMASDDKRTEMFKYAIAFLKENDFSQRTKAIFQKKNNYCKKVTVTTYFCPDTLSIGDSAIGCLNNFAYRNDSPLDNYMAWAGKKILPMRLGYSLSTEELYTKKIISLGKHLKLRKSTFQDAINYFRNVLDRLIEKGLIIENSGIIQVSDEGLLWTDNIIGEFLSTQQKNRSWKIVY